MFCVLMYSHMYCLTTASHSAMVGMDKRSEMTVSTTGRNDGGFRKLKQ